MPSVSEKQRRLMATSKELAYIAGFFDGEGHITITRANVHLGRNPCYRLQVGFTNTDLLTLRWIQSIFGGNLFEKRRHNVNHKIAYELRIGNREMIKILLKSISPFLRLKKKRAELGLAFVTLPKVKMIMVEKRGKSWPLFNANHADIALREEFKNELGKLNERGIHAC